MATSQVVAEGEVVRTVLQQEDETDISEKIEQVIHAPDPSHSSEKSELLKSAHIGGTASQPLRMDNLAPHNNTTTTPHRHVGGTQAIRSVSNWMPDTAERSKLPVQTQIKQITVLQLEKMQEFGVFKNTGGITGLPDGRI